MPEPRRETDNETWLIRNDSREPDALASFASALTVTNGYLALKGALQETGGGPCPLTIVNGVYDELDMFSQIRASNRERPWLDANHFDSAGRSPAIANLPDPSYTRVFWNDRQLHLGAGVESFGQCFDLRDGVYEAEVAWRVDDARIAIHMSRFASLLDPHRAYLRYRFSVSGAGVLRVRHGIDGATYSNVTRERQYAVSEALAVSPNVAQMCAKTLARGHRIQLDVSHSVDAADVSFSQCVIAERERVYFEHEFAAIGAAEFEITRVIQIETSEDERHGAMLPRAKPLDGAAGFDAVLAEQRREWSKLWDVADCEILGDAAAQRAMRFALHHLLAAAPRWSDRLSVPVKLLSGEFYQGNTFYDTDLYIAPFYAHTFPQYARTLLNYRWHGLAPGRAIARKLGYRGAKFAWQSGPYGEECLGDWYWFTRTNIHINGDVAYELMSYFAASGDEEFLHEQGAELLLEIARFYVSRAEHDAARDVYSLKDVSGPDEAHCHSTNNFYTNYFARKALGWAAKLFACESGAAKRLCVEDGEIADWRRVAEKLPLILDECEQVFEQCEGFWKLPPPPADLLENRRDWFVPLAWYQALNQPDVLMAIALFRHEFAESCRRANWLRYMPLSMNFSSMSFVINAMMAADMGDLEAAYRDFYISAALDLEPSLTGRNDTAHGLHGTALGGAWMALVFGFGGVWLTQDELRVEPRLPAKWQGLRFCLRLRGTLVRFDITPTTIVIEAASNGQINLPIHVCGVAERLTPGKCVRVANRR